MKVTGIICEYNPFHKGHQKQIDLIRRSGSAVVCLMSGNFVQRGAPAIFDKSLRAKAALAGGADLVLELPTTYALSSAEGFAAGGVQILSGLCDELCFGCETADENLLMQTAQALLSPAFSGALRRKLDEGLSFPAARQAAMEALGCNADLLENPNDILAVEYCKAILSQGSPMQILPIRREGSYHAQTPDPENPSATALRSRILDKQDWRPYIPEASREFFDGAAVHDIRFGENAVLARLRTMTDAEFEALPYGSEGLWRKLMKNCRSCATLEQILTATKSKRYTRTRLDRMVMCAFLGITRQQLEASVPYTRVLGFNDTGRELLKKARLSGTFLHTGESAEDPLWELEQRWDDLYGLCCASPAPAGGESKRRVYIHKA